MNKKHKHGNYLLANNDNIKRWKSSDTVIVVTFLKEKKIVLHTEENFVDNCWLNVKLSGMINKIGFSKWHKG